MYTLICKTCGKEFENSFKDVKICFECKNRPCVVCGKSFVRTWPYDQKTCSPECRHKLMTDKDNVAQKQAKRKATVQEKYGVDNVAKIPEIRKKISDIKHTEEYKAKVKETSLEKYGVDYYAASPEVRAKAKATMKEKYGFDNAAKNETIRTLISKMLKSPEIREKYIRTSLEHYGVPHPHMDPSVKEKTEQTMINKYGVPYYVMLPEYRSNQATNQVSSLNKAFATMLKDEFGLESEFEFKLENKFFDIHILNSNVLIEINPSYTHSNLPNHWSNGLDPNYHLNKTNIALANGYRCIHVFDWDDLTKIATMLTAKSRLYARKCTAQKLDKSSASRFIAEHHIQGNAQGSEFEYGLFYDNKLVSVMTFGKPRYNKNYQWELLRLCTDSKHEIVGGASKLLRCFIDEVNPESIISYCDQAKFTGSVYTKIGFTLHHISPPNKIWSKDSEYITDNLLRQRGYDQLFNTTFGKGTSNEELMIENGWRSIYDCGQKVFEWIAK